MRAKVAFSPFIIGSKKALKFSLHECGCFVNETIKFKSNIKVKCLIAEI